MAKVTTETERCPVCGAVGTYEHHDDGWVTCFICGLEANGVAAEALEARAPKPDGENPGEDFYREQQQAAWDRYWEEIGEA